MLFSTLLLMIIFSWNRQKSIKLDIMSTWIFCKIFHYYIPTLAIPCTQIVNSQKFEPTLILCSDRSLHSFLSTCLTVCTGVVCECVCVCVPVHITKILFCLFPLTYDHLFPPPCYYPLENYYLSPFPKLNYPIRR